VVKNLSKRFQRLETLVAFDLKLVAGCPTVVTGFGKLLNSILLILELSSLEFRHLFPTYVRFVVVLRRFLGFHIIQTYLPSYLFVGISFLTFLVSSESVLDCLALCMTWVKQGWWRHFLYFIKKVIQTMTGLCLPWRPCFPRANKTHRALAISKISTFSQFCLRFKLTWFIFFDNKNPKSGPGLDIWMVIKKLYILKHILISWPLLYRWRIFYAYSLLYWNTPFFASQNCLTPIIKL